MLQTKETYIYSGARVNVPYPDPRAYAAAPKWAAAEPRRYSAPNNLETRADTPASGRERRLAKGYV